MVRSSKSASFHPVPLACGAIALALGGAACLQAQAADSPAAAQTAAVTAPVTAATASAGKLDVLFMVDDSSSMDGIQKKLADQIPAFISGLQSLPNGLPDLHIAVVSSDMGAPGDSTESISCTPFGDDGVFRGGAVSTSVVGTGGAAGKGLPMDAGGTGGLSGAGTGGAPDGGFGGAGGDTAIFMPCSGLNAGQTFASNSGGVANYTGDLGSLLQCMVGLGEMGCGFEHQLASVARALGADGSPMPIQNADFLRPDAELAIVFLSNEDDCSAPQNTELFSLNVGGSNQQNISNALGPIANYRCNSFGHLCVDPAAGGSACLIEPPLKPPADAQAAAGAGAPTLNLTDCESADGSGLLSSVSAFVSGIKALKSDPANQIVVGAIVAPATPYTVTWVPQDNGQNALPGELWPQVEHSCGAAGMDDLNPAGQLSVAGDDSFGDPAVRLTQFVSAFGANGVMASVCDPSYATVLQNVVAKIGANLPGGSGTVGGGGTGGTGDALPICAGGLNPGPSASNNPGTGGTPGGLHHGFGCDVGAAPPSGLALGLLLGLLVVTWRRRASAR